MNVTAIYQFIEVQFLERILNVCPDKGCIVSYRSPIIILKGTTKFTGGWSGNVHHFDYFILALSTMILILAALGVIWSYRCFKKTHIGSTKPIMKTQLSQNIRRCMQLKVNNSSFLLNSEDSIPSVDPEASIISQCTGLFSFSKVAQFSVNQNESIDLNNSDVEGTSILNYNRQLSSVSNNGWMIKTKTDPKKVTPNKLALSINALVNSYNGSKKVKKENDTSNNLFTLSYFGHHFLKEKDESDGTYFRNYSNHIKSKKNPYHCLADGKDYSSVQTKCFVLSNNEHECTKDCTSMTLVNNLNSSNSEKIVYSPKDYSYNNGIKAHNSSDDRTVVDIQSGSKHVEVVSGKNKNSSSKMVTTYSKQINDIKLKVTKASPHHNLAAKGNVLEHATTHDCNNSMSTTSSIYLLENHTCEILEVCQTISNESDDFCHTFSM